MAFLRNKIREEGEKVVLKIKESDGMETELDLASIGEGTDRGDISEVTTEDILNILQRYQHLDGDDIKQEPTVGEDMADANSLHQSENYQFQKFEEAKKFQCPDCGVGFTMKSNMKVHFRKKHGGVKYPCPECGQGFTQKGNMKVHFKSKHQGMKYPCKQCDFITMYPSNLSTHVKSVHGGINRKRPVQAGN